MVFEKRLHFGGILVGDGEDHEALILEQPVQGIQVRHFFAAGRAPGGPEIHQDDFAAGGLSASRLFRSDPEGEVSGLPVLVVGFQLGHGGVKLRSSGGRLHVFVAYQLGQFHILHGRLTLGVRRKRMFV